jgi:hypothetical protein
MYRALVHWLLYRPRRVLLPSAPAAPPGGFQHWYVQQVINY